MLEKDCIQLKVHGITEAGQAINVDLVCVLQNKLGRQTWTNLKYSIRYFAEIWERGHINLDVLKEKLEWAIQHAFWDVVLEYRLLPFPLCAMTDQDGMVVP